jgi:hypothetical protein
MKAMHVLTAMLVSTLALLPQAAHARSLGGALSMTDGCTLQMELKEGMVSEMFRFVRLKSSPREKVDVTRLGQNGDRLWIGTDYYLYCQKKTDAGYTEEQTYKVGRAHKLWEIKLADGVTLAETESVMNNFTGQGIGNKVLTVTIAKQEKKASDVERAGMKFWLDELIYQYDTPGTRKGKLDNFQVISSALIACLPSKTDDEQERFNNLKVLMTFLKESKDSDLVPFRDLLTRKLAAATEEKAKAKDDADKYDRILAEYEKMKADVMKRTEGF